MDKQKRTYWKGIEQLTNDPEFVKYKDKEFAEYLPIKGSSQDKDLGDAGNSRRDFLKMMGFGIAAATLAACETPVRKAIPYLNKPVDVDPSVPNYYASTYVNGSEYASIVVKTREGRPIKVQGNKLSPVSGGGVTARVEGSVLSLYDVDRLQQPLIKTEGGAYQALNDWAEFDKAAKAKLASAQGSLKVVSRTVLSPTLQSSIDRFAAKYGAEHLVYEPISYAGMRQAYKTSMGESIIPSHDFSKAKTIVSLDADFLGNWLNPLLFSKQFAKTRKLDAEHKEMSRLYAFESNLSLTGANADYRSPVRPSQQGLIAAALYNGVAAQLGGESISGVQKPAVAFLDKAVKDLVASKGAALVVSGSNDPDVQRVVIALNTLLGSYGKTLDTSAPYMGYAGDDKAIATLTKELASGATKGVVFLDCNPVYDTPAGAKLAEAVAKAPVSMSLAYKLDETANTTQLVAANSHYLESWDDAQPVKGHYSLAQPAINTIFNTKQPGDTLLSLAGESDSYLDLLKKNWKAGPFAAQSEFADFQMFWDHALYNGVLSATGAAMPKAPKAEAQAGDSVQAAVAVVEGPATEEAEQTAAPAAAAAPSVSVAGLGSELSKDFKAAGEGLELALYTTIAIGDGTHANNPWLQEMPDPITKACWDNYITMSQSQAKEMGLDMVNGKTKIVSLTLGETTIEAPVLVQPGQAKGTVGLALGYGRDRGGKVSDEVGVNAYPLVSTMGGYQQLAGMAVTIADTGKTYQIAQTQTHETYMGRTNVVQESVLSEYVKNPAAGREDVKIYKEGEFVEPHKAVIWRGHDYNNHHWGMSIDLNTCLGCGACTIACQTENNIPVVGREEVLNRREMHWLRIDRYYSHTPLTDEDVADYKEMEQAAENPEVTFQPMLCQHCNNAPCENVCPVAATTHSTEGLNQMTYNRCVGTRYCANNCPYKVRRFNWFKYHDNAAFDKNVAMSSNLGKMVLNPDVTVRARGVMEKCTFCVQRIQSGKLAAKAEKRRPRDGEIVSACASACPTNAITFGDLMDENSKVAKALDIRDEVNKDGEKVDGHVVSDKVVNEPRAYHVLQELNVSPNVWYKTKIRNKDVSDSQVPHVNEDYNKAADAEKPKEA